MQDARPAVRSSAGGGAVGDSMNRLQVLLCAVFALVSAGAGAPLAGTQPLTTGGDLASLMVDGIDRFLLREPAESVARRPTDRKWAESNYALRRMLGVVDHLEKWEAPQVIAAAGESGIVGRGTGFQAYAVRWPVLKGVEGEGLLLVPVDGQQITGEVIAIP